MPQHITKEDIKSIDPFDVTPEMVSGNDEYRNSLQDRIIKEYRTWLDKKFNEAKAPLIVVCDKEIVLSFDNVDMVIDEQYLDRIEKERNKLCYVFTKDKSPIEDCKWNSLGNDDFYPTIDVYLGNYLWDDKEVSDKGLI